jgi:hypothetical protein
MCDLIVCDHCHLQLKLIRIPVIIIFYSNARSLPLKQFKCDQETPSTSSSLQLPIILLALPLSIMSLKNLYMKRIGRKQRSMIKL